MYVSFDHFDSWAMWSYSSVGGGIGDSAVRAQLDDDSRHHGSIIRSVGDVDDALGSSLLSDTNIVPVRRSMAPASAVQVALRGSGLGGFGCSVEETTEARELVLFHQQRIQEDFDWAVRSVMPHA
jgi:hypothetical protein